MSGILTNQHALVTGGSRGIGAAIANILCKNGARVTLLSQNEKLLETRAKELNAEYSIPNARHDYIAYDLSESGNLESAIKDKYWSQYNDCNILINCAGKTQKNLLVGTPSDEITNIMAVNLLSPIILSKLFVRNAMRAKKVPHPFVLVNISSLVAQKDINLIGTSVYTTSKAGLVRFTDSLRNEMKYTGTRRPGGVAEQLSQSGIHVLLPGHVVDTDIGASVKATGEIPETSATAVAQDVMSIIQNANLKSKFS